MLKKTKISPNIYMYTANNASLNASVLYFDDYCIVIDTLHLPKDSKELKTCIQKPIKYIINTHWHSDHIYGNRFLKQKNTLVVGHKLCMHTFEKEKNILNPNKTYQKPKIDLPDILFSKRIKLDNKLTIINMPGHSLDSSLCYLHSQKILFAGDNVLSSPNNKISVPYFYWGSYSKHLKTLKFIKKLNPKIIVPGHGKIININKINRDILYLKNLLNLFNIFYEQNKKLIEYKFLLKLEESIKASMCLSGYKDTDLWVYAMHSLNLKKLYHDKKAKR